MTEKLGVVKNKAETPHSPLNPESIGTGGGKWITSQGKEGVHSWQPGLTANRLACLTAGVAAS